MEVTVGYGRKLRPDNYSYEHENVEASIFFKSQVSAEIGQLTEEEIDLIEQQAQRLFTIAKIRVLSELGVSYEIHDDGTVKEYHETVADTARALPGTVAVPVPSPPNVPPVLPPPAANGGPNLSALTPEKAALMQEFLSNPSAFWDNRADSNGDPKKPLFRHKTKTNAQGFKAGLWRSDFEKAGIDI